MSVNDFRKPVTKDVFDVKHGPSEYSTTFILGNEDHTLGNPLRHILMQRPETDFCGYSVPHPYEPKMNIRLQTHDKPALEVLKIGLKEVEAMCDILDQVFDSAVQEFSS
eukprot:gene12471-26232_t